MKTSIFLIISGFLFLVVGCSGGGSDPAAPSTQIDPDGSPVLTSDVQAMAGDHYPLFVFELSFDQQLNEIILIPDREALAHYNITSFLNPPGCPDCFSLRILEWNPDEDYFLLQSVLKNPFPDIPPPDFTGFDVRIILDSLVEGYSVADTDTGNPDGYTELWNLYGEERNSFFAISKDDDVTQRAWPPNTISVDNLLFHYPDEEMFMVSDVRVIIDVSWPVNCLEPYQITITGPSDGDEFGEGSQIPVSCEVYSWWGAHDTAIQSVVAVLEKKDSPAVNAEFDLSKDSDNHYSGNFPLEYGTIEAGDYYLWIKSTAGGIETVMWQRTEVTISEVSQPVFEWISPAEATGNDPDFDLTIHGSNLQTVSDVRLVHFLDPTFVIEPTGAVSSSETQVECAFNLTGQLSGYYSVEGEAGLIPVLPINAVPQTGEGLLIRPFPGCQNYKFVYSAVKVVGQEKWSDIHYTDVFRTFDIDLTDYQNNLDEKLMACSPVMSQDGNNVFFHCKVSSDVWNEIRYIDITGLDVYNPPGSFEQVPICSSSVFNFCYPAIHPDWENNHTIACSGLNNGERIYLLDSESPDCENPEQLPYFPNLNWMADWSSDGQKLVWAGYNGAGHIYVSEYPFTAPPSNEHEEGSTYLWHPRFTADDNQVLFTRWGIDDIYIFDLVDDVRLDWLQTDKCERSCDVSPDGSSVILAVQDTCADDNSCDIYITSLENPVDPVPIVIRPGQADWFPAFNPELFDPCYPDTEVPIINDIENWENQHGGITEITVTVYAWDLCTSPEFIEFNWRVTDTDGVWSDNWSAWETGPDIAIGGLHDGTWWLQVVARDPSENESLIYNAGSIEIMDYDPVAIASVDDGFIHDKCDPVTFRDDGSYDPDGGIIVNCEWDWDYDGYYGFIPDDTGFEVTHAWYDFDTDHIVQLRVTDDEGAQSLLNEPIIITTQNAPPVAVPKSNIDQDNLPFCGDIIEFNGLDSHDQDCGDSSIVLYEWVWDYDSDVGFPPDPDAYGPIQYHSWSTPAMHQVCLRVTDDEGATAIQDYSAEVPRAIRLTSPTGGEVMEVGGNWLITWETCGVMPEYVQLSASKKNKDNFGCIVIPSEYDTCGTPEDGEWLWTNIPSGLADEVVYVQLQTYEGGSVRDISNWFSVVFDAECPADDNDSCSLATWLSTPEDYMIGCVSEDDNADWYIFECPGGLHDAEITLKNINIGNPDLYLYVDCHGSPISSSTNLGSQNEYIHISEIANDFYYIEVRHHDGGTTNYTIELGTDCIGNECSEDGNNLCNIATQIPIISNIEGCVDNDDFQDWYLLENTTAISGGTVEYYCPGPGNADMYLWAGQCGNLDLIYVLDGKTQTSCDLPIIATECRLQIIVDGVAQDPILYYLDVNISEFNLTNWDILVYMYEAEDLFNCCRSIINDLEAGGSRTEWLNIVILWASWDHVNDRLMYISRDPDGNNMSIISDDIYDGDVILNDNLNMDEQQTLENFLKWSVKYFPADKNCLIFSDHGNGPLQTPDSPESIISNMSVCGGLPVWDIRDACHNVINDPTIEFDNFDIIAFEACLMGWFETAYCLRHVTDSVIASEMPISYLANTVPPYNIGDGAFNYEPVLNQLRNSDIPHETLCNMFVYEFIQWYNDAIQNTSNGEIWCGNTLSAVRTNYISEVTSYLQSFSNEMIASLDDNYEDIYYAYMWSQDDMGWWGAGEEHECNQLEIKDFKLMVDVIADLYLSFELTEAANNLSESLQNLIITHGHSDHETKCNHEYVCPYEETGLLIWFPLLTGQYNQYSSIYSTNYKGLGMGSTDWPDFLEEWTSHSE